MTTLINRSNHPIHIKRINVRVWTLREEIESTIAHAIKEQGIEHVDIEQFKQFYHSLTPKKFSICNLGVAKADKSEQVNDAADNELVSESDDVQAEAEAEAEVETQAHEETPESAQDEKQELTSVKRVYPDESLSTKGFAFLAEVHMDKMLFFDQRPYTRGQSIVIEFMIPKRFTISAEVTHCIRIERKSKIISDTQPTHRIQCDILYLFDHERALLRDFLRSVEPTIPPSPSQLKRPESPEEEDDFEDLGF